MFNSKKEYQNLLGFMESSNNYKSINGIGALGRYQFMPTTLNSLKRKYNLPDWKNSATFLNNPALQDQYFDALYTDSMNFIKNNNLIQYIGSKRTGKKRYKNITVNINEYGMLAAIHLSGGGNLIKYFKTGADPDDGFTSLSDYLVYFSYKLANLINPALILLALIPAIVLYYS